MYKIQILKGEIFIPAVLITGASRSFGRALFDVYVRRGWTTFPLIRDAGIASRLKDEGGASCHPIVADITDENVEDEIGRVLGQNGKCLNVLINTAGNVYKHRGMESTSMEDLFCVHCAGRGHGSEDCSRSPGRLDRSDR